jgi:hypothetical protein
MARPSCSASSMMLEPLAAEVSPDTASLQLGGQASLRPSRSAGPPALVAGASSVPPSTSSQPWHSL